MNRSESETLVSRRRSRCDSEPSRSLWARTSGSTSLGQMTMGFAFAIIERSGLRKLRAWKLEARQVDERCDRFNVTSL
jgi:hypothetical protein